jgi:DNA-binding NarL/FixJ family response regulator
MDVLIIDDHLITQQVLSAVISSVFEGATVHVASDLEAGIGFAGSLSPPPGLVLLDLGLPGYRGIQALVRFRAAFPDLRVIVVSAADDIKTVRRALEVGAVGYIPKTTSPNVMVAALNLVVAGAVYMPAEVFIRPGKESVATGSLGLTERQLNVLRLVVEGYTNRVIAKELSISVGTVKQHLHVIFDRLGASTRAEVIVAAMRQGLIPKANGRSRSG